MARLSRLEKPELPVQLTRKVKLAGQVFLVIPTFVCNTFGPAWSRETKQSHIPNPYDVSTDDMLLLSCWFNLAGKLEELLAATLDESLRSLP